MNHTLHTAYCLMHITLCTLGTGAVCCRCQDCSIRWCDLLFTEFTFHIIDCFSILSLEWGLVSKKTDNNLSESHTSHRMLLLHFFYTAPQKRTRDTTPKTVTVHFIWQGRGVTLVWFAVHKSTVLLGCTIHSTLYTAHCILHTAPGTKLGTVHCSCQC